MAEFSEGDRKLIRETAVTLPFRYIREELRFARMKADNHDDIEFWEAVLELCMKDKPKKE